MSGQAPGATAATGPQGYQHHQDSEVHLSTESGSHASVEVSVHGVSKSKNTTSDSQRQTHFTLRCYFAKKKA